MRKEKTISENITVSGLGLFTNMPEQIILKPQSVGTGIIFYKKGVYIPASLDYLNYKHIRTTCLFKNHQQILSVEHLMSALYGLGITNVLIEVINDAIPDLTFDMEFINYAYLLKDYLLFQGRFVDLIDLQHELFFEMGDSWARIISCGTSSSVFEIKATIKYPQPIGEQVMIYRHSQQNYLVNLSWARTFLRQSLDSKMVDDQLFWNFAMDCLPILSSPENSPIICFDNQGWITAPDESKEPIRHKILDLIGDLAFLGKGMDGLMIEVYFPGHRFNYFMAKELSRNFNNSRPQK